MPILSKRNTWKGASGKNDYLFVHHGPPRHPSQGAKGRVGIILSPKLAHQWKNGGKRGIKKLVKGGLSYGDTTRFMCLTISFEILKSESNF
jgi:hypothetical protein